MKSFVLLFLVAALAGCEKHDDVARLQDEAHVLVTYYQPKIDMLQRRLDGIFAQGKSIAPGAPGVQDASKRLYDARDRLTAARTALDEAGKKADQLAKERNEADLAALVGETDEKLTDATVAVNDDLLTVESWLAINEQPVNHAPAATPPATEAPAATVQ